MFLRKSLFKLFLRASIFPTSIYQCVSEEATCEMIGRCFTSFGFQLCV